MLFDSWSEFLMIYEEQSKAMSALHSAQPCEVPKADERMDQFRLFIISDHISVTAAAAKVGVSAGTGVRWAKLLNIPFTPRTKRLSAPMLNNVRELLRAGLEKADVIKQGGIASASLNRLISSEPKVAQDWRSARHTAALHAHRILFANAVSVHPGWTTKQLRGLPENGFVWLYRHDREWLLEHLPSIWQQQLQ
jgi:hypothetical protein